MIANHGALDTKRAKKGANHHAFARDSIVRSSISTRPSIAILMPMVWAIRNVVHSGVLERLATAGVEVHLLMRDFDPAILRMPEYADFSFATSCQPLSLPPIKRRIKGRALFREVIQNAFSRRNKIGSYAVYRRWLGRDLTWSRRRRQGVVEFFGTLAQPAPVFFRLYALYDALYRDEYDLGPARAQLEKINPGLLWSTVNHESSFELAYALAARELKIPVVNSVLSFDNLTSKPTFFIYDHYLVWNHGMKAQLLRFYPQVSDSQVRITGTPQFDFHRRPHFRWSRQKTLKQLGMPPQATYALYAASPYTLTPQEPELVAALARRMRRNQTLRDHWLVVRTHPLDDGARWNGIEGASDRVILAQPWNMTPNNDRWALPTGDDEARFISSIAQAAACLNIASTVTLDAAILDRPVIGVRFDDEDDAPEENIYEEYDTDHYRPLVESGGLRVAHNWPELMGLMSQAIKTPEKYREERARMVAQQCGAVDGRSGERVANALLDFLAKGTGGA